MYSLKHKDLLDPIIADELESLIARFTGVFQEEHTVDGAHLQQAVISAGKAENAVEPTRNSDGGIVINQGPSAENGQWWRSGPWTLDDPNLPTTAERNVVGIIPPKTPTGTYNDFAPDGIDKAVLLEVEPDGGDVTLTGLKAFNNKRLLMLRNRDSANSLHLVHNSSSSALGNRFDLPSSTNVELAPNQNVLLYFDPNRGAWTFFITAQAAGGSGALVVDPGSVVRFAELTVTDTQIKSLNSSPIEIVAAPGANKVIVLVWWMLRRNTSGGAYSANPTFYVRYGTAGTDATLVPGTTIALTVAADNTFFRSLPDTTAIVTTDISNNSLVVKTSADVTGGNAANTLKISVAYYVHDLA